MLPARTPFRPSQMTVPETPSPGELQAQQAAAAAPGGRRGGGGRQFVDNTPSKGRVAKAQRTEAAAMAGAGGGGPAGERQGRQCQLIGHGQQVRNAVAFTFGKMGLHLVLQRPQPGPSTTRPDAGPVGMPSTYSEVVAYAERLFVRIRTSVVSQVRAPDGVLGPCNPHGRTASQTYARAHAKAMWTMLTLPHAALLGAPGRPCHAESRVPGAHVLRPGQLGHAGAFCPHRR